MKFFNSTQISSYPFQYWVYPGDVRDIPEPFRPLFDLYSMLHSRQPRNDDPNISVSDLETHFGEPVKFDLLTSSPDCSHSKTEDIQHVREHDPYLQHLLVFEHFRSHIFESGYPVTFLEGILIKHDTYTLLSKQCDNLNYLLNENCFDIKPFSKFRTFIKTKVSALKLQDNKL